MEAEPRDDVLLEIDARQSGEVFYQLVYHLGSGCIALIASDGFDVRSIPVPQDRGLDAMAHPEAYLASEDVIYGSGYEDRISHD